MTGTAGMAAVFLRRRKQFVDPLADDEWSGRIVYGDEFGVGFYMRERLLHGIGSFGSPCDDVDVHECQVRTEFFLEPIEIVGVDRDDRLNDIVTIRE